MGLGLNLVVRVPDPLLGDVNLLGNLNIVGTKSHKTHKIVKFECCKGTNARQNMNVVRGRMHVKITLEISVSQLTNVMTLFNNMKRSGCQVCLRPSMSLGRRKGCSRISARMLA